MTDEQKAIANRFLLRFDRLNNLASQSISNKDKKAMEDMLIDAYIEGYIGVGYMLGEDVIPQPENAYNAAQKDYGGVSIYTTEEGYIDNDDLGGLTRLYESEFHRAYSEGQYDCAEEIGATLKTWVTMGDEKVRDSHTLLDRVTIPIADEFITDDGDHGLYPGGFETAEQNANCRCWLTYDK